MRPRPGITLTESFAMMPGRERQRPLLRRTREARYFARRPDRPRPGRGLRPRKGMPVAEVERWLGPNLAYEPA